MDIDILINKYREFVSENPYEEIWRQLYYFTDVDSVNRKIRERFKLEDGKHENDSKKQAQQIAYSIMQAKSYFESARHVDVSVKPNLIYYGMSSLANTVILYNNDGKFSLDYLRDTKKEEHHGLEKCFDLRKDDSLQDILKNISCKIYKNPNSGEPYGHFKNFYNSIVTECIFIDQAEYILGKNYCREGKKAVPITDKASIFDLNNHKFVLIDTFKFLPDMVQQLQNNGIISNLCHGQIKFSKYIKKPQQNKETNNSIQDERYKLIFIINDLSPEKKDYFRQLHLKNTDIQDSSPLKADYPHGLVFLYDSRYDKKEDDDNVMPCMVQNLLGEVYYIYNAEEYIQELANLYICFFCTGMLCRYYPDFWMHWIEKNVGFKHLMETLCSIAIRKFPNLILNQLTHCINYFHL